tara:strand:- start:194 stop:319 length:126 start_codon:yes stop_codon:yes gene_type:complete
MWRAQIIRKIRTKGFNAWPRNIVGVRMFDLRTEAIPKEDVR